MSASISMPPGSGALILLGSLPLLVLSEYQSRFHAGTYLFKMMSSIAFLSGPLLQLGANESEYCKLITIGLVFSLLGDFFLLPSREDFNNRSSGKERKISVSFQLGVVAFAAAHIAYIVGFLRDSQGISWPISATTFVTTMILAKWLGVIYPPSHSSLSNNMLDLAITPDMKPLVFIYATIISSMFAVAVSTVPSSLSSVWVYQRTVGAAMFVASDIFVAKDAFGRSSAPDQRGWFRIAVGYGLYFWGQMIIAGTVQEICALPVDDHAVHALLDEKYDKELLCKAQHDENDYNLGRIGRHNIVIVVPPIELTGIVYATLVASDLKSSFPSIRFALMVGIGGGAPTAEDIRLGDVVIGTKIVPYRFGQERTDGFHYSGQSKPAPKLLRAKITELQYRLLSQEPCTQQSIDEARNRNERAAVYYSRPTEDHLFLTSYPHQAPGQDCQHCVASPSTLVTRELRQTGQKTIACAGAIASADQVMKSAKMRDQIAKEQNVICFEMESAGIMERLECLAIRGISDYSDSHKNDAWQRYAALSATGCSNELLSLLYLIEISNTSMSATPEEMKRFIDTAVKKAESLSIIEEVVTSHTHKIQETREAFDRVKGRLDVMQDWFDSIKLSDAKDAIQKTWDQVKQIQALDQQLNDALERVKTVAHSQQQMTTDFVTRAEWKALEARVSEQESRLKTLSKSTSQAMVLTREVLASAQELSGNTRLGTVSNLLRKGAGLPDVLASFYSRLKDQTPLQPTLKPPRIPQLSFKPGIPSRNIFGPGRKTVSDPDGSAWDRLKLRFKPSGQPEQQANKSDRPRSPGQEADVRRLQESTNLIEELKSQEWRLNHTSRVTTAALERVSSPPHVQPPVSGKGNVKRLAQNFNVG